MLQIGRYLRGTIRRKSYITNHDFFGDFKLTIIHTLDARDNLELPVLKDYFKIPHSAMRHHILSELDRLSTGLSKFGIQYKELSSALVPSCDPSRNEIVYIFNADKLSDHYNYIVAALEKIIPALDAKSNHSFLVGDLVPGLSIGQLLDLSQRAGTTWIQAPEYHSVAAIYANNLSKTQQERIHNNLENDLSYMGFANLNQDTNFRRVVAGQLRSRYVKYRKSFIAPSDQEIVQSGHDQSLGVDFDTLGYRCVNVPSTLYDKFLCFKIEIPANILEDDTDILISLNSISANPMRLNDLEIFISEEKFQYLVTQKRGLLTAAGIKASRSEHIADLIKKRIGGNYIYRMKFNQDNTVQFSIVLSFDREHGDPVRLSAGLKYFPKEGRLTLVTIT